MDPCCRDRSDCSVVVVSVLCWGDGDDGGGMLRGCGECGLVVVVPCGGDRSCFTSAHPTGFSWVADASVLKADLRTIVVTRVELYPVVCAKVGELGE